MSWLVSASNGNKIIPLKVLPLPPGYNNGKKLGMYPPPLPTTPLIMYPPSLPPTPPPRIYKYVTDDPELQLMCLIIITELNYMISNNYSNEICRFFLRGTNVVPFIKHDFVDDFKFPYTLTSDFDCTALLNPKLSKEEYKVYHTNILDTLFLKFIEIANDNRRWQIVRNAVNNFNKIDNEQAKISIANLNENYPIRMDNMNRYTPYTPLNTLASPGGKYDNILKDSPFYVYKLNNLTISGRDGTTYISQVKLGIRVKNPKRSHLYTMIDLIDISIPKQEDTYIHKLWYLTFGIEKHIEYITLPNGFRTVIEFNKLDLPGTIKNLEYAANVKRETRKNKRNKRNATAKNLRNFYNSEVKPERPNNKEKKRQKARFGFEILDLNK